MSMDDCGVINSSSDQEKVSWTWADQISTYRFWGILIFYFLSGLGMGIFNIIYPVKFVTDTNQYSVFIAVMTVSALLSLYPAWHSI